MDVTHIASVIASAQETSGTISTAPEAFETRRELSGSEVSGLDYRGASRTAVGGARTLRSLLSLARAVTAIPEGASGFDLTLMKS